MRRRPPPFLVPLLATLLITGNTASRAQAGTIERTVEPATQVAILVNENVPESVRVGEYYAEKRGIPAPMICRVKTVKGEGITWPKFREQLLGPVTEFLSKHPDVLYLVPTYGIPLRVVEENKENNQPDSKDIYAKFVTTRDYCCVDAELALIPRGEHAIEGWIMSEYFQKNEKLTKEHKLLIVSRLDGPTPDIAMALVDQALYAEAYGMEGENYLDTRGLTEGGYYFRDNEMRQIATVFEEYGVLLNHEDTEQEQDLALYEKPLHYWGWYAGHIIASKPFRFQVGGVGAHVHSFAAATIRNKEKHWVGPLLYYGITGTCGAVFEPLTSGVPRGAVFYDRFFAGYTFGEAMNMANQTLSWMAVFVGDPLYAPYARGMKETQQKNRHLVQEGYEEAIVAIEEGRYDEAETALQELAAIGIPCSGTEDVGFLLREISARREDAGSKAGSIRLLKEKIELGRQQLDAGNHKEAISQLRDGLELSPRSFECNVLLGRCYLEMERPDSALRVLQAAQEVDTGPLELHALLGKAYVLTRRYARGIEELSTVLDRKYDAECYQLLGMAYLGKKEFDKAAEILTSIYEMNKTDRGLGLELAKLHLKAKDYEKAASILGELSSLLPETRSELPDYCGVYRLLFEVSVKSRDRAKAAEYQKLIKDMSRKRFAPLSRSAAARIDREVDDIAGAKEYENLPELPTYSRSTPGLPCLFVRNQSDFPVQLYVSGPTSRFLSLKKPRKKESAKVYELALFPGKYQLAVVIVKSAREKVVLFRAQELRIGPDYGLGVAENLKIVKPEK